MEFKWAELINCSVITCVKYEFNLFNWLEEWKANGFWFDSVIKLHLLTALLADALLSAFLENNWMQKLGDYQHVPSVKKV